ncbi:hypothetical protein BY996DRAFT_7488335, partial [Phakopsora pachyrhizi]
KSRWSPLEGLILFMSGKFLWGSIIARVESVLREVPVKIFLKLILLPKVQKVSLGLRQIAHFTSLSSQSHLPA